LEEKINNKKKIMLKYFYTQIQEARDNFLFLKKVFFDKQGRGII